MTSHSESWRLTHEVRPGDERDSMGACWFLSNRDHRSFFIGHSINNVINTKYAHWNDYLTSIFLGSRDGGGNL